MNFRFFRVYAGQLNTDPQAGRTEEDIYRGSPEILVFSESREMEPGELVGDLTDLTFQAAQTDPSIHTGTVNRDPRSVNRGCIFLGYGVSAK